MFANSSGRCSTQLGMLRLADKASPGGLLWRSALLVGGINAAGFAITYATKTHKVTDLCGVGAFGLAALDALRRLARQAGPTHSVLYTTAPQLTGLASPGLQAQLLCACVVLWSLRLGSFLVYRVHVLGTDDRLTPYIESPPKLGLFWSLSFAWGFTSLLPVTLAPAAALASPAGVLAVPALLARAALLSGLSMFATGLAIESAADWQKFSWKQRQKQKKDKTDGWLDGGLRRYCRYPQYFGEICVWTGLYVASLPLLLTAPGGGALCALSLLSPLAVYFFTAKASGASRTWYPDPGGELRAPLRTPSSIPGLQAQNESAGALVAPPVNSTLQQC